MAPRWSPLYHRRCDKRFRHGCLIHPRLLLSEDAPPPGSWLQCTKGAVAPRRADVLGRVDSMLPADVSEETHGCYSTTQAPARILRSRLLLGVGCLVPAAHRAQAELVHRPGDAPDAGGYSWTCACRTDRWWAGSSTFHPPRPCVLAGCSGVVWGRAPAPTGPC